VQGGEVKVTKLDAFYARILKKRELNNKYRRERIQPVRLDKEIA